MTPYHLGRIRDAAAAAGGAAVDVDCRDERHDSVDHPRGTRPVTALLNPGRSFVYQLLWLLRRFIGSVASTLTVQNLA